MTRRTIRRLTKPRRFIILCTRAMRWKNIRLQRELRLCTRELDEAEHQLQMRIARLPSGSRARREAVHALFKLVTKRNRLGL